MSNLVKQLIVLSFLLLSGVGWAVSVSHEASFSVDDVSFREILGYEVITLLECDYLTERGKPMVPFRRLHVALPEGSRVVGVDIERTEEVQLEGLHDVWPAQPPRTLSERMRTPGPIVIDREAYQSSEPYPELHLELAHEGDFAGQSVATINVYPLRYVPRTRRVLLLRQIVFRLETRAGQCRDFLSPNASEIGRRTRERMLKRLVINPEDVQVRSADPRESFLLSSCAYDHVVITSNSLAPAFEPLKDWHTRKGMRDTVVTTEWIYSYISGSDDAEKIRNFIADASSTWGVLYILLGGEGSTVPFVYRTMEDEETPSDQYYSDFDDDWINEVMVGRLPVDDTVEVSRFVGKILKYETDPNVEAYPLEVLLVGMDADSSSPAEHLKESIDEFIPDEFTVTKVYDSQTGNHRTATIDALNQGQNLVNHCDHSGYGWMGTGMFNHGWMIEEADVDALGNTDETSVIVSVGCHANAMDQNDCISEHFVVYNDRCGGVAFTGNTRSGYYHPGQPPTLTGLLDWEWWNGLFSYDQVTLGQALVWSKHRFSHSSTLSRHCEWTFNLLGDPAMPVWTGDPESLTVEYPRVLLAGEAQSLEVAVHAGEVSVSAAIVCLWKHGDYYAVAETNEWGLVSFDLPAMTTGTLCVTVTKQNCLPNSSEAIVVETQFVRGDSDGDMEVGMSDVVQILGHIYLPGGCLLQCAEAADADDSGVTSMADALFLVRFLYIPGSPLPPAPGPFSCGVDPTPDDLGCLVHPCMKSFTIDGQ